MTLYGVPITLGTAGVLGLIFVALSFNVVRCRIDTRTITGDGAGTAGAQKMQTAIRMHGNFAEYVPMALLLIGGIEAAGAPRPLVLALCVALVLARIAHPVGMMMKAPNPPRAGGAILTWAVLLVAAIEAIVRVVEG